MNYENLYNQDYNNIINFTNNNKNINNNNKLWEDPYFPATSDSLFPGDSRDIWKNIVWKRPYQICSNPQLVVNNQPIESINQRTIGNCWFLSPLVSLYSSIQKSFFDVLVPQNINHFNFNYNGIFSFRFWKFGKWIQVLVDDRLPCKPEKDGEISLAFAHSTLSNEFWVPLVEKAYAKLKGCYGNINIGNSSEALVDLTGGIVVETRWKEENLQPQSILSSLREALDQGFLCTCAIDNENDNENKKASGLVPNHVFSIKNIIQIINNKKIANLLQIKNTWGSKFIWKGRWGQSSNEYKKNEEKLKKIHLRTDNGDFLMCLNDFINYFDCIQVCMVPNEENKLKIINLNGNWVNYFSAGGSQKHKSFPSNPKFLLEVKGRRALVPMVIGLMRGDEKNQDLSENKKKENKKIFIGFRVFQVPGSIVDGEDSSRTSFPLEFFSFALRLNKNIYTDSREITLKLDLTPGFYLIVPSTLNPGEEGDFLLRILSNQESSLIKIKEEKKFIIKKVKLIFNQNYFL